MKIKQRFGIAAFALGLGLTWILLASIGRAAPVPPVPAEINWHPRTANDALDGGTEAQAESEISLAEIERAARDWLRNDSAHAPDAAAQTNAPPMVEFVGQIGGSSYAVAVSGTMAYVGVGPRLVVLDISQPATPTVVGQTPPLPGIVQGVAIAPGGGYVYVANGNDGLRVIDVSTPVSPTEVGFYDAPRYAYGVAVAPGGGYVYVADDDEGLRVIDVSDPVSPTEAAFYDTPGTAYGVAAALAGGYVYVADYDGGLTILRILEPTPPDSVAISGPTTGTVNTACTFTATVSSVTATTPITYEWQISGSANQQTITHTGGVSDTAVISWTTDGVKTITVTASNAGGAVTGTHNVTIAGTESSYKLYHNIFYKNSYGLTSTLYLQNPNGEQATVGLAFYDLSLSGIIPTLEIQQAISARGTLMLPSESVGGLPDGRYSLVVMSDRPVQSVVHLHRSSISGDELAVYRGAGSSAYIEYFGPFYKNEFGQLNSSLAVWNVGAVPAAIVVEFLYPDGSIAVTETQIVTPNAQYSFVGLLLDGLPDAFTGWARVTADQPVVGLLGQSSDEIFQYQGALVPPGGMDSMLRVLKGVDEGCGPRTTTLFVGNTGAAEANATLNYYTASTARRKSLHSYFAPRGSSDPRLERRFCRFAVDFRHAKPGSDDPYGAWEPGKCPSTDEGFAPLCTSGTLAHSSTFTLPTLGATTIDMNDQGSLPGGNVWSVVLSGDQPLVIGEQTDYDSVSTCSTGAYGTRAGMDLSLPLGQFCGLAQSRGAGSDCIHRHARGGVCHAERGQILGYLSRVAGTRLEPVQQFRTSPLDGRDDASRPDALAGRRRRRDVESHGG